LKREKGAKQENAKECGRNVPSVWCNFEMVVLPLKFEERGANGAVYAREEKAHWGENDVFGDGPS
jgi:hypothetical protein